MSSPENGTNCLMSKHVYFSQLLVDNGNTYKVNGSSILPILSKASVGKNAKLKTLNVLEDGKIYYKMIREERFIRKCFVSKIYGPSFKSCSQTAELTTIVTLSPKQLLTSHRTIDITRERGQNVQKNITSRIDRFYPVFSR